VILIGGFAQSPALRARLEAVLGKEKNYLGQQIQLLAPRIPYVISALFLEINAYSQRSRAHRSTVVARGAALRAFDKNHGPDRITSCSYGFLITEHYDPIKYEEHREVECIVDEVNGEKYIENTIRWLIKKVCTSQKRLFIHLIQVTFLGRY